MGNEMVLVVDDSPDNLVLTQFLLESEGFEVRTAEDAEQALAVLGTCCPQVILMDVQLPGMDGLELTRQLRADPRWSEVVIVALTAYAMKGDEENCLAAGCDGYITKPVDTRTFASIVRDQMKARRISQAYPGGPACENRGARRQP
jgi:two-component system cell cycle response regulator DivK